MRPSSSASFGGRRAPWLATALGALMLLPGTAAAATPAPPTPALVGDAVLVNFSGSIKGNVLLSELAGGDMRIAVTLNGGPGGKIRLVGSPDGCETALPLAERSFSLPFDSIRWVRTTVSGLMAEEGIFYYRSIRLVQPGSPNRQLACRQVRYLRASTTTTVAYQLENVMITSFVVAGGVRGMIAAGAGTFDPVPLTAVIQRRAPGATYRLVGSTAPCGTSHQANKTVFDRTFPASGVITRGITAVDDWEALTSFRIVRGTGFSQQVRCMQDGVQEFVEIF